MTEKSPLRALPITALYRRCDEKSLGFATTLELPCVDTPLGQERAEEAMRFALSMRDDGYNVFVMGREGAGRHRFVRRLLEEHARTEPVPSDLCYVNRLQAPTEPRALVLPKGRGAQFRSDMQRLVDSLRAAIRAAFDSDDYRGRRQVLEHEVQERHEQALEEVHHESKERNLAFMRTPMGFAFAPTENGEIISPDAFAKLDEAQQQRIKDHISEMEQKLANALAQLPRVQREGHERLRELNREVIDFAVKPSFEELTTRYADLPPVCAWLSEVRAEIGERAEAFLADEDGKEANALAMALGEAQPQRWPARRYTVNVLVDRSEQVGAPVVYEDHPTLENLVGRIEHRAQLGNLVTDFTMIQPGALHRANGGHLVLDAQKLLEQPQAYEALKRALRSRQVRIESLAETVGFSAAGRLTPEPMPLETKVTLVGNRRLYYLLATYDPEFDQLFKISADFADDLPRTEESERAFAQRLASVVVERKLLPFSASGMARVIEHASRLCEDAGRISLEMQSLLDLMREAHYFATRDNAPNVTREHVEKAVRAVERRADRIREESLRLFQEGTMLVSTSGKTVGQVNALSVLMLGSFAFGRPSRVTCRVRIGRGELIDIEREVRLGGPIHTKGVLILSGLLGARYAKERPLSLSASLVFEQSYGGVDGDSASLAELCALLSAIAEVPIEQRFAMTGSVNQMGEVQPIGGVNEKIEGFFDACVARGLTSDQAVIIPESNVRHLMLRADVVQAISEGKFAVYAVRHMDEALALLTGMDVGEQHADGTYPEGSFHARVEARLNAFTERAKALSSGGVERRVEVTPQGPPPEPGIPGPPPNGGGGGP